MKNTIELKVGEKTVDVSKFFNRNLEGAEKASEIKKAVIKDEYCSYTYELLTGKTKGDMISRKGVHIVHEDMLNAFVNLEVFLAHLDDAFNSWAVNQTPIQELEADEKLDLYTVTAFKIAGIEENQAVILCGNKQVANGMISFETPKIKLLGSYLYAEELQMRLQVAINEVELYSEGKAAPQFEQSSMEFPDDTEPDFDNAKLN